MPSVDARDDLVDLAAEVTRLRDAMLHAERERSDDYPGSRDPGGVDTPQTRCRPNFDRLAEAVPRSP